MHRTPHPLGHLELSLGGVRMGNICTGFVCHSVVGQLSGHKVHPARASRAAWVNA